MIKYQGISTLEVLEGADRYNKWIAETISSFVKPPVLEVGSGTGNITQLFLDKQPFYATDVDSGLVLKLREKFASNREIHIEELDIVLSLRTDYVLRFKTIFAINVLEHIANDTLALANIYKALRNNGRVILLVPAKRRAFTKLDKALGHYRRYEKEELRNKLEESGFIVDKIFYFNFLGLLSWLVRDKFERKNFHLKPYQISLFDSIVPILKQIEKRIEVPVGISLIVVARKKSR